MHWETCKSDFAFKVNNSLHLPEDLAFVVVSSLDISGLFLFSCTEFLKVRVADRAFITLYFNYSVTRPLLIREI